MLGLAFAILNSWTALSTSFSLALPSGGPVSVIWGLVTAGIFNLCLAISLAEFLSAYPTTGGQYHWVHIISWHSWKPLLPWITGWINVCRWMSLVATGGLLGSHIIGIIAIYDSTFEVQKWHQFLIYLGFVVVATLLNAFGNSILPMVNNTAIIWSISGFVVICITVLAYASPDYNSGDFDYFREALHLPGYDGTAHMIEEAPNGAVEGPKIMIYCGVIGVFTGFIFLSCLLFVVGHDVNEVIESAAGSVHQIILNATKSRAGTVILLLFPLACMLFCINSIMATSSGMTYAFARDGGLPFSRFFACMHKKLDVPLEALGLTAAVVFIIGLIFLGSTNVFNAMVSASIVSLGLPYGIPIAIHCLRGRKQLPPTRTFILPEWLGWTLNLTGVVFVPVATFLFVFPPELPMDGNNMNYFIVAFGTVFMISVIQWCADGKKNYDGPKIDIDESILVSVNSVEIATPELDEFGQPKGERKGASNV